MNEQTKIILALMQIDNLINDRRITKYLIGTIIIQNILELSKL